jgi:hypothetical protein
MQSATRMNKQIEASEPSSRDDRLPDASTNATDRDPLVKAVDRLQSELHRLENRLSHLEGQFHSYTVRHAISNGDRLQIAIDTAKRIDAVEARLASRKPSNAQKRSRRGASQRRKAA